MRSRWTSIFAVPGALCALAPLVIAGPIDVPNASFELPVTPYVSIVIDSWQKSPKPDWYVEEGGFLWSQLIGAFKNQPTNAVDYIDNMDGDQATWLFAVPEVALFQDYMSVGGVNTEPGHEFDAAYEAGKSYCLTVGVIGGGGGMLEGVPLQVGLYYRDAASNRVMVASTTVLHSFAVFTNTAHFVNFTLNLSTVRASDAWAGEHIGIECLSTVSTNMEGGYWDLDHVRLVEVAEPVFSDPVQVGGQFQCVVQSEPGLVFDIVTSTDFAAPVSSWASLGTFTNTTGSLPFSIPLVSGQQLFGTRRVP